MTVLSQRDPRWAKKKLGFSTLTIGGYGCTLTCLTMLINQFSKIQYTPNEVNDKLKKVNAFTGALLIWSRVPIAFPFLKFNKRAYNYNNLEVALYVYVKKTPVMVEVNGAKIGAPKHWVLFIGGGKMNDPWTGKQSSTNTYPLTGYSLFEKR